MFDINILFVCKIGVIVPQVELHDLQCHNRSWQESATCFIDLIQDDSSSSSVVVSDVTIKITFLLLKVGNYFALVVENMPEVNQVQFICMTK